jgi:hypothetical protein
VQLFIITSRPSPSWYIFLHKLQLYDLYLQARQLW